MITLFPRVEPVPVCDWCGRAHPEHQLCEAKR